MVKERRAAWICPRMGWWGPATIIVGFGEGGASRTMHLLVKGVVERQHQSSHVGQDGGACLMRGEVRRTGWEGLSSKDARAHAMSWCYVTGLCVTEGGRGEWHSSTCLV